MRTAIGLAFVGAVCFVVLSAQTSVGTIVGVVTDPTGAAIPNATVMVENTETGEVTHLETGVDGRYRFRTLRPGTYRFTFALEGFKSVEVLIAIRHGDRLRRDVVLQLGDVTETISVTAASPTFQTESNTIGFASGRGGGSGGGTFRVHGEFNTEEYGHIKTEGFVAVKNTPRSTFSIDVDTAFYSNVRRFLRDGGLPPADAVRIEELINYFDYEYPDPADGEPFSITTEIADCPWKQDHKLVHIGLRSKSIAIGNLPPNNIVFLLDVSGSMDSADKLPLLKKAFALLADQLRPQDRVSIVVYAGAAGVVLDPTSGAEKQKIFRALAGLDAGGSTAGGEGIQLAYRLARKNFLQQGNNRVVLATDGDFNVGVSSDGELVRIIESEREHGIFLTVLGFGSGNLKDSKMEKLADHGNGNYAYIDSLLEARKVLVEQMGATLLTVAKDVKLQVEFNPAQVKAYRLIGYENRRLRDEEFNDDKKDAGDLGAGHSVTALYEIVPAGSDEAVPDVDPLRYQKTVALKQASSDKEVLTVKLRYKRPGERGSQLLSRTLEEASATTTASPQLTFASAVAEFGLLLRDSPYKGDADFERIFERASGALGGDNDGRRAEFLFLVKTASKLFRESESARATGP